MTKVNRLYCKWVKKMEQDKLKTLLKTIINEIENDKLTTLEEIIQMMQHEFQSISPALSK